MGPLPLEDLFCMLPGLCFVAYETAIKITAMWNGGYENQNKTICIKQQSPGKKEKQKYPSLFLVLL